MAMAEAVNNHLGVANDQGSDIERRQYEIALISEMYHTASLYHDDVIDKAELRRGKDSANLRWGEKTSIFGGNYVIATSNVMLAKLRDPKVIGVKSQMLNWSAQDLRQFKSSGTWKIPLILVRAPFFLSLEKSASVRGIKKNNWMHVIFA